MTRAQLAQSRAFAGAYRTARQPSAYTGPYPILTGRTCAETARDECAHPHAVGDAR